ncbi:MAG: HD domain-containing protein [Myxococcales bacterium]
MPVMDGFAVCRELKADERLQEVPVVFLSALSDTSDKVQAFAAGGVDYITKPYHFAEVEARVAAQVRLHRLQVQNRQFNLLLQEKVREQVREISESQLATIVALAKLAEHRDEDTGNHILRVQRYCRLLARRLADEKAFGSAVDDGFVETIFQASALHDIGKVGIPDGVLLKPGRHTPDEWEVMKSHSALGAETLGAVLESYPGNAFIRMGRDIARSHHERYDGTGYPDGLAGDDIPIAARILALADQYDALRNKRPYKPAFDAEKTYAIITVGDGRSDPKHLDPRVLAAFKAIAGEFEEIFQQLTDPRPEVPVVEAV